jgi:tetratricopeptide (TPR) repeat protein
MEEMVSSLGQIRSAVGQEAYDSASLCIRRAGELLRGCAAFGLMAVLFACLATPAHAKQDDRDWIAQIRTLAAAQDWDGAMKVVEQQAAGRPADVEVREWRARVLTWSGKLDAAEKEWNEVVKIEPNDPDNWLGLAALYRREGRLDDADRAIDRALELDPKRADLRAEKGRILRSEGELRDARSEFQRALAMDPGSEEARIGLHSVEGNYKNELRLGQDNDLFNFTDANNDGWVSLTTRWNSRWGTSEAGDFFQRGGTDAGKFVGSVTRWQPHWGALTIGGAEGHDNGVIPRTEAFFDYDHALTISEDKLVRGVELTYGQHWYWYSTARILTFNGMSIFYFPKDWRFSFGLTGARSVFNGTGVDWKPSGLSRLDVPLGRWSSQALSGNVFFAAGTEDFGEIDQIGSFASQTYGGGVKYQFTPRQDVSGFAFYQRRTQDRTQTSFGFSYGIHF